MMRFLLAGILFCAAMHSHAEGCWSAKEKSNLEGFDEMAGNVILSLKDAVTCQPIANAKVLIGDSQYQSDSFGDVELEDMDFSMMDKRLKMKVQHPAYVDYQQRLRFEAGTLVQRRFLISKKMDVGKWRFVLTWPKRPRDLDLHLRSDDFHISYQDKKAVAGAKLDRDARFGYGPETITLNKTYAGKGYQLFVHNYSSAFPVSGQLDVYQGNSLRQTIVLPSTRKRFVMLGNIIDHQFVADVQPRDRP